MTTASTCASSVDLTEGVAANQLEEGVPFAGEVGGEAVLLVRQGRDVFAVAATCTHYGGPLAEGIVVNGQVRCPWHHACFSLRTGDATAPALNPLDRWRVTERNGKVFVTEKYRSRDPLEMRGTSHSTVRAVVIVGAGAAGCAAAEALRSNGFKGTIAMIDPDDAAPYDRPNLSKDYLAGSAPDEWLPLRPPGFHAQHGIRRVKEAAVGVDTVSRRVTLASGEFISYDALILATGAAPVRTRIPGVHMPHVHVLRTLDDCKSLIAAAETAEHVVIAGASFIGMETAAALRHRNLNVTVVAPDLIPFSQVLGPTIGASLLRLHERHGVRFALGRKLAAIAEDHVMLDDRTKLAADVVLLGVGVRPRLQLAEAAGVEIDSGVVVNEYLETSVPRVYAVGDIARFPDPATGRRIRIEHWVVAQRQGETAARNVLGQQVSFSTVPFFWTRQYDTTVCYVGHAEDFTHIQVDGSPDAGDCSASIMHGDRLAAFVTIGRDGESLIKESEMETWAS